MVTFDALLTMLLLCAVGFCLRKCRLLDDHFIAKLNRLLVFVASPAMMINASQSVSGGNVVKQYLFVACYAALSMALIMTVVRYIIGRKAGDKAAVMASASALGNVGFMGMPLIALLFGQEAVFYVTAFCMGFNVVQWSLGVWIYGGKGKAELGINTFVMPLISLVSFLMVLLRIRLPNFFASSLQHLSNLNTPLAMMIIGARMEKLHLSDLKDGRVWTVALIKLIAFPMIAICVSSVFSIDPLIRNVLIFCSAMPSAANVQIQVELYEGDSDLAAKCIAVTTLVSMITILVLRLLV